MVGQLGHQQVGQQLVGDQMDCLAQWVVVWQSILLLVCLLVNLEFVVLVILLEEEIQHDRFQLVLHQ